MDFCAAAKAVSNDAQINVQVTILTPLQPLRARHTRADVPLPMDYRRPLRLVWTYITQHMLTSQVYTIVESKNKPLKQK